MHQGQTSAKLMQNGFREDCNILISAADIKHEKNGRLVIRVRVRVMVLGLRFNLEVRICLT